MLKHIKINELYNRFNYDIVFTNNITIITGPNGYGKSTILKLINASINGAILYLIQIAFSNIIIYYDNQKIEIKKTSKYIYFGDNRVSIEKLQELKYYIDRYYDRYYRRYYSQTVRRRYVDVVENEEQFNIVSYESIEMIPIKDIKKIIGHFVDESKQIMNIEKFYEKLAYKPDEIKFVSDQRMYKKIWKDDEQLFIEIIKLLPMNLKDKIDDVLKSYYQISNELDSTYPHRLFESKDGISSIEYNKEIENVNAKLEQLQKYNLVNLSKLKRANYKDEYKNALKIYFDDFNNKFTVFNELLKKLNLFTDIINRKLNFKTIKISAENGLEIIDIENGRNIDTYNLSSGEKQEIILFYELIFNSDGKHLLLLDEPEISLHIAWQNNFLKDIKCIVDLNDNLQIILATHSPHILSDNWDLNVDLGELYHAKR